MTVGLVMMLVAFSFLLATGQILFKKVAATSVSLASFDGLIGLAFNPWFWTSMVLYGAATLLWIFILQKINLVQAYPFMALGFIIVPIAAHFIFGETINIYYFAGVALILAGLWFIVVKAGAGA